MAVSRKTQRTGTFGRLTNVTAQGGKTSGKQSSRPGDNLDSGNGSEEDGVENRSEPQGWLADGSPDSAGSAQDADPAAGVKTAPPLYGTGSTEVGKTVDPDQDSPSAADTADPLPPTPAATSPGDRGDRSGWDSRGSGSGSGSGSQRNGGSSASSNGGPSAPAGRPSPDAGHSPSVVTAAASAAGLAGASSMSAPYATPDPARGGPHTTSQFQTPTKPRPRPGRPGKGRSAASQGATQRPMSSGGQRPAPAGFPAQGSPSSRKAQLAIARIEPWSVMKFAFMISLVGWVILFVAVALLYFVLQKIGVFTSIEHTVGLITASKTRTGANAASWFSSSRVLGYTMLIGAVNVILITALSTVGAVLYNLVTMLAGGIEITLKETD
jgi:hypothetical protein